MLIIIIIIIIIIRESGFTRCGVKPLPPFFQRCVTRPISAWFRVHGRRTRPTRCPTGLVAAVWNEPAAFRASVRCLSAPRCPTVPRCTARVLRCRKPCLLRSLSAKRFMSTSRAVVATPGGLFTYICCLFASDHKIRRNWKIGTQKKTRDAKR